VTPEVSIVIACRNAELTLDVQLTALAAQECPVPWNVVISDNGSTDATIAIARRFADQLPELVVVDSSDRPGAGHARNVGARATQARLLVFCDADDEAAPGWLAAMVRALENNQFVAGRFESERLNSARILRSRPLQQSTGLQESPFGPGLPHAGAGNLGIKREVFFRVGGFDPTVGCLEDTDLCWRIQLIGVPLVFAPEAAMHVRLRASLRTMWAQGQQYGAASALLAHRYPPSTVAAGSRALMSTGSATGAPGFTGPQTPADTLAATPHRVPGAGRRATLIALLRDQRSLGSLLWTLGWHVGHRRWHPPRVALNAPDGRAVDAA
jgi:cellulose synthase/poly-beta-1,6-N-acetylglucosamine synthase-like glycosyltransferase